jgi:thiol:disulfide interchange protein DsbC
MKTTRLIGAFLATALFASASFAQDVLSEAAMLSKLKQKYQNTTFKSVTATPLPGVYEVVMGKNVAYVEETGRYFVFGHLFDMQTQTDMTEGKIASVATANRIDFSKLPLADAVVSVKGDGSRKIAVFSDPDCPYCKQLENNLTTLNNVTIYTFLFPLEQLHPQAKAKSIGVWCAADRAKALSDLMLRNITTSGNCDNPIERNIALAQQMGVNGTPTIILTDGTIMPGAPAASKLEQMLQGVGKVAAK